MAVRSIAPDSRRICVHGRETDILGMKESAAVDRAWSVKDWSDGCVVELLNDWSFVKKFGMIVRAGAEDTSSTCGGGSF